MTAVPLAILRTGLVTSVGLTAPATCAAIRAGVTNPTETHFIDSTGTWVMAHQVPLEQGHRGLTRLAKMAALALEECLADTPLTDLVHLPVMLCVAERDRPGRAAGLDSQLLPQIERELGARFSDKSLLVPHGRASVGAALVQARKLIEANVAPYVIILATDSLLSWPTLEAYDRSRRLLTSENSDGFMPGEGAGAVLVGPANKHAGLVCTGIGLAVESAHIDSEQPLRGDGLAEAFKLALREAGCEMHELDFRIADLSGEQYYFKEAALAVARVMRVLKHGFDIWHPAECIGETGALAGAATIAVAEAACRKKYARGSNMLLHAAADSGQRVATILQYRVA